MSCRFYQIVSEHPQTLPCGRFAHLPPWYLHGFTQTPHPPQFPLAASNPWRDGFRQKCHSEREERVDLKGQG